MVKPTFVIIGAGKVGSALAFALTRQGYPLLGVVSRNLESAQRLAQFFQAEYAVTAAALAGKADIVFITTPDNVIGEVVAELADNGGFKQGQAVFHVCGAVGANLLEPATRFGAVIGAMHPLKSFAAPGPADFSGIYFAVDGEPAAVKLAQVLIGELGGQSFQVPQGQRPLYHAAACIASNYLVALMHWTSQICGGFGLQEEAALQAFLPLVRGTLENVEKMGTIQALSGPISRGDTKTVGCHLQSLDNPQEKKLYLVLGEYVVRLACQKGTIQDEQMQQLLKMLHGGVE